MAFSSNPQLLIHEGELSEILAIIKSKGSKVKIVGTLFGLWRNSLTQPVVHLITGPGKTARIQKDKFSNDFSYVNRCKEYLRTNHGLLQIGLWCSGSIRRYPKLDPQSHGFTINPSMPDGGNNIVFLFVNTETNLSVDYYIINRNQPQYFTNRKLRGEDILPGPSCFRLLQPISDAINHGAMFFSKGQEKKRCFSKSEFNDADRPRVHERSESSNEQWYETDFGRPLFAQLLQDFERNSVSVEISRSQKSRDITLELNGKLCLNFPREFPEEEASLSWVNDRRAGRSSNKNEISGRLVERVVRVLRVS